MVGASVAAWNAAILPFQRYEKTLWIYKVAQNIEPRLYALHFISDMRKRVAFITFGCRTNQSETEALAREFCSRGWHWVQRKDIADLYIIHSCTVTARSDAKLRQAVRNLARQHPDATMAVVGCGVHLHADSLKRLPGVISVADNRDKWSLPRRLSRPGSKIGSPVNIRHSPHRTRATVKIQEGCDRKCAYCVVPLVRGKPRSEPFDKACREIRSRIREGYKEIVLAGTHLGLYRSEEKTLEDLLDRVSESKGDFRIRLSSLEPGEITPRIIEYAAHHPRVCPHLHLSLQSLCDKVLDSMARNTPCVKIEKLLNRIHRQNADIRIGADLIVGFPTETRSQFRETIRRVETVPLHYGHVFRFSARPGTRAEALKQRHPGPEMTERSRALRACLQKKHLAFLESQLGKTRCLLVENAVRKSGLTDNYLRMRIRGGRPLQQNRLYAARVRDVNLRETVGELCLERESPWHFPG